MVEKNIINIWLFDQRLRKGLSQKEVGKRMGCSQSKVSKIESKPDGDITIGELSDFAFALGYKIDLVAKPLTPANESE